jgi:hypothetical protein
MLFDQGSRFLTFIHAPDDGSAEPKHVVYWHNLRVKWCGVQNNIRCGVSVSLITV